MGSIGNIKGEIFKIDRMQRWFVAGLATVAWECPMRLELPKIKFVSACEEQNSYYLYLLSWKAWFNSSFP